MASSKPWKGICSHGCWYAKKKRCKCRCKGQYHQRDFKQLEADEVKKEIVDQDELQLKDETNKPWVEAWRKAVKSPSNARAAEKTQ